MGHNGVDKNTRSLSIRDVSFVVTDTETTGTSADTQRIIEIAAVKVRGGQIVDQFSQLINPGVSVPRFISQMTGITTAMLFNEPSTAEVMPRFLEFLGDGVLVAHNLPFDQRFIDAELRRMGKGPLTNPTLCTLRLARRLLPGLPSKGLAPVAAFLGIKFRARHRALGDAEVTARVLLRFLAQLGYEYGVETLGELLTFQNRRYSKPEVEPKHLRYIRNEVLPQLPDRPGVYFMKDTSGRVIYIGKAKSLRDRVRSYFTSIEGHAARTRKMIGRVRDITWTETGSELGALLLESRLIKEQKPPFNRAQLRYRTRPFLRIETSSPYPRISWSPFVLNDGAEYFGPVAGRRRAELVVEVINRFYRLRECDDATFARSSQCVYYSMDRCSAPCGGKSDPEQYRREVQRVRDFLTGKDHSVLDRLEEAMKQAAAQFDFEQAARYRDWWRKLGQIAARQESIAVPVMEHNSVLILSDSGPSRVRLYIVRFGRLVETLIVNLPPESADIERLRERLSRHFLRMKRQPQRYLKKEIDEVHILANWLYSNRDHSIQVRWNSERNFDDFVDEIMSSLNAMSKNLPELAGDYSGN